MRKIMTLKKIDFQFLLLFTQKYIIKIGSTIKINDHKEWQFVDRKKLSREFLSFHNAKSNPKQVTGETIDHSTGDAIDSCAII